MIRRGTYMRCVKLLLFSLILIWSCPVFAAISLTNGYWSTTFNCSDWTQPAALSCDGVESNDDSAYAGSQGSQILSAANNSSGGGGSGYRTYYTGDEVNEMSSMMNIELPTGITEFWLRWYYRIPDGQSMDDIGEHKIAYLFDTTTGHAVDWPAQGFDQAMLSNVGTDRYFDNLPGGSWSDIYGDTTADGRWICFEVHAKLGDSGQSNGVFDLWVNGVNQVHITDVNWSAERWENIEIPQNHRVFTLNGNNPHDIDDMAVATLSYTGFVKDAGNRDMIGPVGESTPTCSDDIQNGDETGVDCGGSCDACPSTPSQPTKGTRIFYEGFEDNSWTSRDWYDDGSAGNTLTASGGQTGNALTWAWAEDATAPTSWATMRKPFPASASASEFIIEYYVYLATGWQGSGAAYHPHLIHLLSTADGAWQGTSSTYSSLYFELNGSYLRTLHQDELRVNTSNGAVPNNLVEVIETRSANHCNTPYTLSGADAGDCYAHSENYASYNIWEADTLAIPANTWTKITAHVKRNTFTNGVGNFDGIMRVWVGDELAIDSDTVLYAAGAYQTTAWDKVVLAPYIGDGSPSDQTMRLDELSIYEVAGSTPATGRLRTSTGVFLRAYGGGHIGVAE